MKKLLSFVLMISTTSVAVADTIYESNANKVAGACTNGRAFSGLIDSGGYWTVTGPSGTHFSKSQLEAIHKACSVKTIKHSFIQVKKGALVYLTQNGKDGIINGLGSEISYSSVKAMAMLKENDNYFITSTGGKLKLLETFQNKELIDTYYKATGGGEIVYVRKSETE